MDARDSVDQPPFRANSKIGVGVSQVVMDSRSSVTLTLSFFTFSFRSTVASLRCLCIREVASSPSSLLSEAVFSLGAATVLAWMASFYWWATSFSKLKVRDLLIAMLSAPNATAAFPVLFESAAWDSGDLAGCLRAVAFCLLAADSDRGSLLFYIALTALLINYSLICSCLDRRWSRTRCGFFENFVWKNGFCLQLLARKVGWLYLWAF